MRLQRRLKLVETLDSPPRTGGIMRVAVCTQDMQHIDAHFGWAKTIQIFEVSPDGYALSETCQFGGAMFEDGNEDKLIPKLEAIGDCAIVYLSAIGASAAARVVAKKIHPVKVEATETISGAMDRLVTAIRTNPPPWLRKALGKGQTKTFEFEDDEE